MADPDFTLLPSDEEGATDIDARLDAAEEALLTDPAQLAAQVQAPIPFGRSWSFDWQGGRFYRSGTAPTEVRGEGALIQWIQAAMHTASGAHPIFSNAFGLEDPEAVLDQLDPEEALDDFEADMREALTQHDRIQDVQDFAATFDPSTGVVTITSLTVVTDVNEELSLPPLVVRTEV